MYDRGGGGGGRREGDLNLDKNEGGVCRLTGTYRDSVCYLLLGNV